MKYKLSRHKPRFKICTRLKENIWGDSRFSNDNNYKKKKWSIIKKKPIIKHVNSLNNSHPFNLIRRKNFLYNNKLLAKQKMKAFYGCSKEYQFKNFFNKRNKYKSSVFGFQIALERRLASILFRLGFVKTIYQARQWILYGKIYINNQKITQTNYIIKNGDLITIHPSIQKYVYLNVLHFNKNKTILKIFPKYLAVNYNTLQAIFIKEPLIKEIIYPTYIDFNLIQDYYT